MSLRFVMGGRIELLEIKVFIITWEFSFTFLG